MSEFVLRVEDLRKSFPIRGKKKVHARASTASASTSPRARPWPWSASPAAASQRRRDWCRVSCRLPAAESSTTAWTSPNGSSAAAVAPLVDPDGFPGSVHLPRSADDVPRHSRGATAGAAPLQRGERKRIDTLLERVGIDPSFSSRSPSTMSGGQRQRLGIARALALEPRLVVLDEPVSALDASIQAQVLNLLEELQREMGVAFLFISHDLAVVRHIADRVMVMYMGRIVESGSSEPLFAMPQHPYTQGLMSAVPLEHPDLRTSARIRLSLGEPGDPSNPPSGCRYRTRCFKAQDICAIEDPVVTDRVTDVACLFPEHRDLASIRPTLSIAS